MKKILLFLLLTVPMFAQEHVWRYKDYSGRLWNNWIGETTDTLAYKFNITETDSIISRSINIGKWNGNFAIYTKIVKLSGTLNVKFKVETWNGFEWTKADNGKKFDISWRKLSSDSSATSTVVGTTIGNTEDGVLLVFSTGELLNDSNYGWADMIYENIRITAVFTDTQSGYLYQYILPNKK